MKLPRWAFWVGLLLVVALVLSYLGRGQGGPSEEAHQRAVDAALRAGKAYRASQDSLREIAAAAAAAARRGRAEVARYADSIARLELVSQGRALTAAEDSALHMGFRGQIAALGRLVDTLQVQASTDSTRADLAEARVARLEGLLAADPARCKILFWDCPTRTTSFWVGVATGTVATAGVIIVADRLTQK